jgi:hypothetical protein
VVLEVAEESTARKIRGRTPMLARQRDMQRVMEVIAPLRVDPAPMRRPGAYHARIVEIALRDEGHRSTGAVLEVIDRLRELLEERPRGRVGEGVHGIQPQPIH